MNAVWYRLRVEARSTLRSFIPIGLLIGLAGGVVIAAFDGAQRTDNAYPAFLRHAHASDVDAGIEALNGEEVSFLDEIEALPQVVAHARHAYAFIRTVKPNGEPDLSTTTLGQPVVSVDGALFRTIDSEKIVSGRHADPSRPDEITVSHQLVKQFHVRVGSEVNAASWSPAASVQVLQSQSEVKSDGPRFKLHIVGDVVAPGELAASSFDNTPVHLTPAFFREYAGRIGTSQGTRLRLRHGAADIAAFRAAAARLAPPGGRFSIIDQPGLTAKVQRSVHLQAVSLRLFALLVAVAGAMVVGQALGRQLLMAAEEYPVLRGVGMTRVQLVSLSLARAALAGVGGAAVAVALAVAFSPLAPIGLGRIVAPSLGAHVDLGSLAPGFAIVVATSLVMAGWPAWRSASASAGHGKTGYVVVRRSRLAEAMARAALPPSAFTGTRLALESGSGRTAVPVRSTIIGAVLAVAALAASLSFGASLSNLLDSPRLYGWSWDVTVGNPYAFDIRDTVLPILVRDRDVARVAVVSTASVDVEGRSLTALGIESVRGTITPPLVSGRSPTQPDELSVGSKTLREMHRHVGDTVTISGTAGSRRMKIVGAAVYPSVGVSDPGGVGEGVGMTIGGLRAVVAETPQNIYPIVLAAGVDVDKKVAQLQKMFTVGQVNAFKPIRPTDVDNYKEVRPAPVILAGLFGVTAMGTLAHTLVSSVRRRRRDLALLKTLGFLRRQIRATVAWQATVLSAIALLVGLPLGVVAGRWSWRLYAIQQGVVPEPVVPWLVLALLVPTMVVAANVIAAMPAASAARTRPGLSLRSE